MILMLTISNPPAKWSYPLGGHPCIASYHVFQLMYTMHLREYDVRYWQKHNMVFARGCPSPEDIGKISRHRYVENVTVLTEEEEKRFSGHFDKWKNMMDYIGNNPDKSFCYWIKTRSYE